METKIKLINGDITKLAVDAIVNAANTTLLGGGGVDGAIHRAAGPGLLSECRKLGGCEVGKAKITLGYNLNSKYVIHTVGPIYHGGTRSENLKLASCYLNCLLLASQYECNSIAFPNISTGIYGYPKQEAAEIAIGEVFKFLRKDSTIQEVIFCCYDAGNYQIYNDLLKLSGEG